MGALVALLPILTPIVARIAGALFPDPGERDRFIQQFFAQLATADLAQLEVNKAEAASPSVFVAGWRPFIGWTCGVALAWNYVIAPFVAWTFVVTGWIGTPLPGISLDDNMWLLLLGMLGLGAMRTVDKIKGVGKKLL